MYFSPSVLGAPLIFIVGMNNVYFPSTLQLTFHYKVT